MVCNDRARIEKDDRANKMSRGDEWAFFAVMSNRDLLGQIYGQIANSFMYFIKSGRAHLLTDDILNRFDITLTGNEIQCIMKNNQIFERVIKKYMVAKSYWQLRYDTNIFQYIEREGSHFQLDVLKSLIYDFPYEHIAFSAFRLGHIPVIEWIIKNKPYPGQHYTVDFPHVFEWLYKYYGGHEPNLEGHESCGCLQSALEAVLHRFTVTHVCIEKFVQNGQLDYIVAIGAVKPELITKEQLKIAVISGRFEVIEWYFNRLPNISKTFLKRLKCIVLTKNYKHWTGGEKNKVLYLIQRKRKETTIH